MRKAQKGELNSKFVVDGDAVVVREAYLLPLTHFVLVETQHTDTKLYLGLGLGLGLGLVAVVTLLVAATYYYRR